MLAVECSTIYVKKPPDHRLFHTECNNMFQEIKEIQRKSTLLPLHAPEANVFPLGKLVDALPRSLSAKARFFDASKGRLVRADEALVDAHHSYLQGLADSPTLPYII